MKPRSLLTPVREARLTTAREPSSLARMARQLSPVLGDVAIADYSDYEPKMMDQPSLTPTPGTSFADVIFERRIVPFLPSIRVGRFVFPTSLERIEGLDLSRFPMEIEVCSARGHDRGVLIQVRLKVRDRDNPDRWIHTATTTEIGQHAMQDEKLVERTLYCFVEQAVRHELDECWLVNGERVRDPHEGEL